MKNKTDRERFSSGDVFLKIASRAASAFMGVWSI